MGKKHTHHKPIEPNREPPPQSVGQKAPRLKRIPISCFIMMWYGLMGFFSEQPSLASYSPEEKSGTNGVQANANANISVVGLAYSVF